MDEKERRLQVVMEEFNRYKVPELQEFLRKTGRVIGGTKKELLTRIENAFMEADAPPYDIVPEEEFLRYIDKRKSMGEKKHRLKVVMEEFNRYKVSELQKFLKKVGRHIGGTRNNLLTKIENAFMGADTQKYNIAPEEEFLRYIDKLKENGCQYIFLFRLRRGQRTYLNELRNMKQIGGVELGFSRDAWFESKPLLAAVVKHDSPTPCLFFKWVRTRKWNVKDGLKEKEERAVNFFRINLRTGDAELRIQTLKRFPADSLRDEYTLYCGLLNKIIDMDRFDRVPFDLFIRKLLTKTHKKIEIKQWSIKIGTRNELSYKGGPSYMKRRGFKFQKYPGVRFKGKWLLKEKSARKWLLFDVNSKNDAIKLSGRCHGIDLDQLLKQLKVKEPYVTEIPELGRLAKSRVDWTPVLHKLDAHLSGGGERKIEVGRFAGDEWLTHDLVHEVVAKLAERFTEVFKAKRYVVCPKTKKKVSNNKKTLWFDLQQEIPPVVPCEHTAPHFTHDVPTKGNVRQQLIYTPHKPKVGLIPLLSPTVTKLVGPKYSERIIVALTLLLFSSLYTPMVIGSWWALFTLAERFTNFQKFLLLPMIP